MENEIRALAVAIVNPKTRRTGLPVCRSSKKTELRAANPARLGAHGSEAATPARETLTSRVLASQAIKPAVANSRSSFNSAPVSFIAPRTASRWAVAFAAAAEYRPCSAVSRGGGVSVVRHENRPRLFCRQSQARHNPSLNHRTHYGGPSWPGLGYAVHFPNPGQAVPPQRSG
jgi:hypothetical protein